jgi:hypothetical protein
MPIDLFKQAGIAPDDSGKPAPRDLFAEAGINPNLIERSGGWVTESKSPSTRFEQLATKGAALQLDKALDAMFPELEGINARYGARKDLVEALEQYVGRRGNKVIKGLDSADLAASGTKKGMPAAVFNETLGHPQIKARLAFLLNKVRQSKDLPLIGDRYITRQISKGIPIAAAEAEE